MCWLNLLRRFGRLDDLLKFCRELPTRVEGGVMDFELLNQFIVLVSAASLLAVLHIAASAMHEED